MCACVRACVCVCVCACVCVCVCVCACVHACVCVFLSFLRCFSLDNYYFYLFLFLFLFIFSSQIFKNVHLITQAFGRPVVVDTLCDGEDVQIPLLTNSFFRWIHLPLLRCT